MYDFPANIHVRQLAILCVTFPCVCHFPIRFPGSGVVCDQLMLQTARSATETSLKIKISMYEMQLINIQENDSQMRYSDHGCTGWSAPLM